MDSPSVSVVTPSYNQGAYIEDTIRSVEAQSYADIEHIIVDGASSDRTQVILEQYDDIIRWISETDEGQVDAITKGFDIASGDIVTWLNSDDIYVTVDAISNAVDVFENGTDVVFGDLVYMSADLEFTKMYCPPSFDYGKFRTGTISMPPQPSTFFDTTVFEEEPLDKNLSFVFDYEHWLRIGDTVTTKYINEPVAGFRFHDESKTVSTPESFDEERDIVERRHDVHGESSSPKEAMVKLVHSTAPRRVKALAKFRRLKRDRKGLTLPEEISYAPWSKVYWRTMTDGLL